MEMLCGDDPIMRTRLNTSWRGAWVLAETYYPSRGAAQATALQWGRRFGVWLTLPEDKHRNAWRWLCLRLRPSGPIYAIRWTLPDAREQRSKGGRVN